MSELSGESSLLRSSITTSVAPTPRKFNDLTDFTIDKLNYASLGLHGREKELKLLKSTFNTPVGGR